MRRQNLLGVLLGLLQNLDIAHHYEGKADPQDVRRADRHLAEKAHIRDVKVIPHQDVEVALGQGEEVNPPLVLCTANILHLDDVQGVDPELDVMVTEREIKRRTTILTGKTEIAIRGSGIRKRVLIESLRRIQE